MADDKKGCWIETFTGKKFHVLDPKPEEIDILDIAHALSMQCRYSGHVKKFYSVAEHSTFVSFLCPDAPLEGLLHDASEAYISDLSRPVKYFSEVGKHYKEVESHLMKAIAEKFGISTNFPKSVHYADGVMLYSEKDQLMNPEVQWDGVCEGDSPKERVSVYCYPHDVAKQHFLERFESLTKGEFKNAA